MLFWLLSFLCLSKTYKFCIMDINFTNIYSLKFQGFSFKFCKASSIFELFGTLNKFSTWIMPIQALKREWERSGLQLHMAGQQRPGFQLGRSGLTLHKDYRPTWTICTTDREWSASCSPNRPYLIQMFQIARNCDSAELLWPVCILRSVVAGKKARGQVSQLLRIRVNSLWWLKDLMPQKINIEKRLWKGSSYQKCNITLYNLPKGP